MYVLRFTPRAVADLKKIKNLEPTIQKKIEGLLRELEEHPRIGTGHPEPLKGEPKGCWSRRITAQHRLIYQILDKEILILILSAYGHYEDK